MPNPLPNNSHMANVGKNIQLLLEEKGVSQASIAKMLGVKPPSVHNVITGRRATPRIRQAIALALGLSESELWPDTKPQTQEEAV